MTSPSMPEPVRGDGGWWVPDGAGGWAWRPDPPAAAPRASRWRALPRGLRVFLGVWAGLAVLVGAGAVASAFDDKPEPVAAVAVTPEAPVEPEVAPEPPPEPTPEPTAAPTPEPTPAPTPMPVIDPGPLAPAAPPDGFLGNGTYVVGTDVQPGTYRSDGPTDGRLFCYWARLSSLGGNADDIIANDNNAGVTTVTIDAADRGFKTSGCRPWSRIG